MDYVEYFDKKTKEIQNEAHEQADRLNLKSVERHNDSVDAFRHAYSSGRIVQDYLLGESVARKIGFQHEQVNEKSLDWNWQETVMDLFNNEYGRDVARLNPSFTPDQLANHIYKHGIVENGLIQNLAAPRIEEYKEYYLKQLDKNWLLSEQQPEQSQEQKQAKSQTLNTAWDIINAAYEASLADNPHQALKQVMEQAEQGAFGQQVKQEQVTLTQQYEEQQMQIAQQTLAEAQVIRGPVMRR